MLLDERRKWCTVGRNRDLVNRQANENGAILIAANVAGWIAGFAVSNVTVALAAMLWRSRRL